MNRQSSFFVAEIERAFSPALSLSTMVPQFPEFLSLPFFLGPPPTGNATFRQICVPNTTQALYARICNNMLDSSTLPPEVFGLQLLPLAVIAAQCPLAGNEAASGLDILRVPKQRADALKAIAAAGGLVMSGPIELVQGGFDMVGLVSVSVPAPS